MDLDDDVAAAAAWQLQRRDWVASVESVEAARWPERLPWEISDGASPSVSRGALRLLGPCTCCCLAKGFRADGSPGIGRGVAWGDPSSVGEADPMLRDKESGSPGGMQPDGGLCDCFAAFLHGRRPVGEALGSPLISEHQGQALEDAAARIIQHNLGNLIRLGQEAKHRDRVIDDFRQRRLALLAAAAEEKKKKEKEEESERQQQQLLAQKAKRGKKPYEKGNIRIAEYAGLVNKLSPTRIEVAADDEAQAASQDRRGGGLTDEAPHDAAQPWRELHVRPRSADERKAQQRLVAARHVPGATVTHSTRYVVAATPLPGAQGAGEDVSHSVRPDFRARRKA